MVIAHRGASAYAPENTMAAFDLALQMGACQLELDVQLTGDEHIVVIHDDTVKRTTNAVGLVISYTLAALKNLDAGSWFGIQFVGERIPTLEEVLKRYKGQVHFHIEIKGQSPNLSSRTADLIRKYDMQEQVTITSFQKKRLEEMRSYAPEFTTAWLIVAARKPIIAQAQELGFSQLCPLANLVTPRLVNRIHEEGLLVRAWGVKTEKLMHKVVQAEADGMTVNFPDKLIAYMESHKLQWQ
jgi:glycerophosphoryl diester phosphodiesterase